MRQNSMWITGASGFLGLNAVDYFSKNADVTGIYHHNRFTHPKAKALQLDLQDFPVLEKRFLEEKPTLVLHCAADSNVDHCENNRADAYRINVESTKRLSELCAASGSKLVFISSDAFYEGNKRFSETDAPTPVNYYGETKLLAEQAIESSNPNHIIVRTNFFGFGSAKKHSFSDWIIAKAHSNAQMPLFEDVHFSPVLVTALCESIHKLAEKNYKGKIHIVSDECVSKYEFGVKLCDVFGFDKSKILKTSWKNGGLTAKRSNAMCLTNVKLKSLVPEIDLSLSKSMNDLKAQQSAGYDKKIRSMVE